MTDLESGAALTGDAPMVTLPATRSIPAGWRVIGAREFTEHLLSVRFIALFLVLGLAGMLAIYAVAGSFREAASAIASQAAGSLTGQQFPVFPLLFTQSPAIPGISGQTFPSFAGLVALLGPVLGIAFGFDAISSERSEGTLPRLVSQPIHRDDVINGKFVAGLAVITMILAAVIVMLSGVGIIRLGIVPNVDVGLRLVTWFLVASIFVAFWL
ncbi:MAG: ABC transporter permease, partial [Chloroflexi bacterium]|nr:ABC transporter permease [Chloroflexota bacterium]